jgi:hypothetical protein
MSSDPDLRKLAASGDRDAFLAELDRRVAAWLARISADTPEGRAELARFRRRALADPEVRDSLEFTPYGQDASMAGEIRPGCPDGGACHHGCTRGCFRGVTAGPLSAAGWGEQWPAWVREAYSDTDGRL